MDFFSALAMPTYAFFIALVMVPCIAYLTYKHPIHQKKKEQKQEQEQEQQLQGERQSIAPRYSSKLYWRRIAFCSEILVAGSLIGVITFVGKAKIQSDIVALEVSVSEKKNSVATSLLAVSKESCSDRTKNASAEEGAVLKEVCNLATNFYSFHQEVFPSEEQRVTKQRLHEARLKELVESKKINGKLEEAVSAFIDARKNLEAALAKVRVKHFDAEYLTSVEAWWLIFFVAVMAIFGVAFKCARTFSEYWDERKSMHAVPSSSSAE